MSFIKCLTAAAGEAAAVTTDELIAEIERRRISDNVFPLDVFHPNIRPFITDLHTKFDIPRCYVGLSMLVAYSTAIGTAYAVSRNDSDRMCLSVWGCMNGISSSGKSLALDMCLEPLNKIQRDFDQQWETETEESTDDARMKMSMKTVVYRDAFVPTLIRYIMPANPKGVLKESDEILEWINGLNSLSKKEGTDEQFWLSAWNGRKYTAIRSGNVKINIPRVFTNIVGGIQPGLLYKLFKNDRGTSGFIFRLLFANPEQHKIAEPVPGYSMPAEYRDLHERHIRRLYEDLYVESAYDDPKLIVPSYEAMKLFREWERKKIGAINEIGDESERNIHAGVLGKMKEYTYRFAGLLRVADIGYNQSPFDPTAYFPAEINFNAEVMERAIRLADYFYQSAIDVYKRVELTVTAPYEVLYMANLMRSGKNIRQMAEIMLGSKEKKSTMQRKLREAIRQYPKIFGAENQG